MKQGYILDSKYGCMHMDVKLIELIQFVEIKGQVMCRTVDN